MKVVRNITKGNLTEKQVKFREKYFRCKRCGSTYVNYRQANGKVWCRACGKEWVIK